MLYVLFEVLSMESEKTKRIVFGALLGISALIIFLLTIQSPEGTMNLSETVRGFLTRNGIECTAHQIRSFAHLPEFFLIGLFLALLFSSLNKKPWLAVIVGLLIGTADECLRIFLPTREFDPHDLIRDYIGVIIGVAFALLLRYLSKRKSNSIK